MSDPWYFAEGESARGPVRAGNLSVLLARLNNQQTVLIWREGLDRWKRARAIQEAGGARRLPSSALGDLPLVAAASVAPVDPPSGIVQAAKTATQKSVVAMSLVAASVASLFGKSRQAVSPSPSDPSPSDPSPSDPNPSDPADRPASLSISTKALLKAE